MPTTSTAVAHAIENAIAEENRPSLIRVRSHIGYGSPNRQDTSKAHGQALGVEEVKLTKRFYGWPEEPAFYVPDEALKRFRDCGARGRELESQWNERFERYATAHASEAAELKSMLAGELPKGWDAELPQFSPKDTLATRESGSRAEQAIAKKVWNLFGGAADLNESTFVDVVDGGDFERHDYLGRNLHFGIREHGMCAILNGVALHGGFIPYGSSFLIFTDYCRPSLRLAALMGVHVIYVFTHDSIGLGEDGPTHQAVEQLSGLRAIPNFTVIRPGDANEAAEAWRAAMMHRGGPVLLALTRQKLPTLDRAAMAPARELARGGYVLSETKGRERGDNSAGERLRTAARGRAPRKSSKSAATRFASSACRAWKCSKSRTRHIAIRFCRLRFVAGSRSKRPRRCRGTDGSALRATCSG